MRKEQPLVSCLHHFDTTYHYPAVNLTSERHCTSKEKHHSSSDKSIIHRNVDDKQKTVFLLLGGILTLTSRDLRMLLSVVVQHFLSSETDE